MISTDPTGKPVDPTLYRSMIGSLLYLTASRLDIAFNVGVWSLYSSSGTWYSRETNLVVTGYSDADWASNADDRKSTFGGCFYVANNLVAWMSRKQSSIFVSTVEAEYIAAGSYCTQLVWMKKLLCDYVFN
jgi:hypothetical protein